MITLITHADGFLISAIFIGIVFSYFYWIYNYSNNSQVPLICKPIIPFGTIPTHLGKFENVGIAFKECYLIAKGRGHKIVKAFLGIIPMYGLVDLQYTKYILQIDFDHFDDRGFYYNEENDLLGATIFAFRGEKWRFMRSKLAPYFTPGKIKKMFDTVLQCGYQLEDALENKQVVDVNELSSSYTINVIGSYAFGIDCNSFKDPNMEFKKLGEEVFDLTFYKMLKIYLGFFFPNFASKLGVRIFSQESLVFFKNLAKEVVEHRVKNNVTREDMMQILMDLHKKDENTGMDKTNCDDFNYKEIAADMFLFFVGGYETAALTLTHCLYEIALNQEIQKKLRDEIQQVLQANADGKITYDALMDMKYMSQVIDETLRKHPPAAFNVRKAVKDYTIPGTDIELPTNSHVFYSILGIHHDPEFYPEPEKFDPERFSTENKKRIPAFAYLPFGEGPRTCIAPRFGIMQVKVALAFLLKTYKVSLNEKTKLPLKYKFFSISHTPSTQIYLNIEKV